MEPVRNFPPMNDNLSRSLAQIKIACDSSVIRRKECLPEGRIVYFRKAPARLFWEMQSFRMDT